MTQHVDGVINLWIWVIIHWRKWH